jgi:hypothetical protein
MTGKAKRYGNSGFPWHQINWCTYLLYRIVCLFTVSDKSSAKKVNPILITGLFRSGTTITAKLFNEMGYSAGPDEHLLKARGERRILNPEGFLENYFFMDLSTYLFHKTQSWGDIPPTYDVIEKMELLKNDRHKLAKFSIIRLHDDRISNVQKLKILAAYNVCEPGAYLETNFPEKSFIKNPHFAVLFLYFKKMFPQSPFVFVFREPAAAVNSAKKVSPVADYDLYNAYYREACKEHKTGNLNIVFLSYENLVNDTKHSLQQITMHFKIKNADVEKLAENIHSNSVIGLKNDVPENVNSLYHYMLLNCINKK